MCVHPFADGNGRVARALASVYLYRAPGVPLVVFSDQKALYLDALEVADAGQPAQFVRFIGDCAIDTVEMVRTEMRRRPGPSIQQRIGRLQKSLLAQGGLSHAEVDALAVRFVEQLGAEITRQIADLALQPPLSSEYVQVHANSHPAAPGGYRLVPTSPRSIIVRVNSAAPAHADIARVYSVAIARPDNADAADFVLFNDSGLLLEAYQRDLHPVPTEALRYRLRSVVEDVLAVMLDEAVAAAEHSLRTHGYLT